MEDYESAKRIMALVIRRQVDAQLEENLDFLRAVLGEAIGFHVDAVELQVVLSSLVDAKVLRPLAEEPPVVRLAEGGVAIADTMVSRLPLTLRERVEVLVEQYAAFPADGRADFRQQLLSSLPRSSDIMVERAVRADPSAYAINATTIRVRRRDYTLFKAEYQLVDAHRLSFEARIDNVKNRFIRQLGLAAPDWVVAWSTSKDSFNTLSTVAPPSQIDYYQASIRMVQASSASEIPEERREFVEDEVLLHSLKADLESKGWKKERFRNIFYNYGEKRNRRRDGLSFSEYPTYLIEIFRPSRPSLNGEETRMVLVADPRQHQFVTLHDWVESRQSVEALLNACKLFEDEGAFQTLPERDRCNLEREEDLHAMEGVRSSVHVNLVYSRKSDVVHAGDIAINRDTLESALSRSPSRPPATLDPAERFEVTRQWLLHTVPKILRPHAFEFEVLGDITELPVLSELDKSATTWRLSPPKLLFNKSRQGESVTTDPRDVFRFGPYDGPRQTGIAVVLSPNDLSREDILRALNALSRAYKSIGLGELATDASQIAFYTGSDIEQVRPVLQSLPKQEKKPEVILAIGKRGVKRVYGLSKDMSAGIARRACQFCHQSTATTIARGSYPTAKGLALQIFLKALAVGESPWILRETISKKRTLCVGIGYSRRPLGGEDVTSHASISLADGVEVRWKALGFSMRPRRYFDPELADSFIRFLQVEASNQPDLERVLVLRRGDTYPAEKSAIKSSLRRASVDWEMDFVGITDSNIRVFRKSEPVSNPEAGILFLLSDDRCLLSMSALPGESVPEGSVRLLQLTRAIGNTSIEEIGRELYDQTFLCWGSPAKPPKVPISLDLAEKVASLAIETSREEVFDFFPL